MPVSSLEKPFAHIAAFGFSVLWGCVQLRHAWVHMAVQDIDLLVRRLVHLNSPKAGWFVIVDRMGLLSAGINSLFVC